MLLQGTHIARTRKLLEPSRSAPLRSPIRPAMRVGVAGAPPEGSVRSLPSTPQRLRQPVLCEVSGEQYGREMGDELRLTLLERTKVHAEVLVPLIRAMEEEMGRAPPGPAGSGRPSPPVSP